MSQSQNVIEFNVSLFFKDKPHFSQKELVESWGREEYTCENFSDKGDNLIGLFRGETAITIGHIKEIQHDEHPDYYPAITNANINYDETYLVNHKVAFEDFQSAKYEVALTFRIMEQANAIIPHNELAITLLGIRQVIPIDAIWMEHLDVFVGKEDLEEFTDWVSTQDGRPLSIPYPLLFGVLIKEEGTMITAWTTGLPYFNHKDLFIASEAITALDAARVLFNSGISIINGRKFEPNESMETGGVWCQIREDILFDEPALQFIPNANEETRK